jgi:hypothetical protein
MGRRDAGGNCQERTSATTAGAAYAAQEKGRRWISCRNVNRPAEGRPIPTRSVLFISRSRCVPATCPIVREAHSRSQNVRHRAVRSPSNSCACGVAELSGAATVVPALATGCGVARAWRHRLEARRPAWADLDGLLAKAPAGAKRRPQSPRLRVVFRRDHEVGAVGAAPRAAKPQLGQRHIAAPRQHERLQISVGLVAARLAEHQHAGIAGAQCGACRGQFVGHCCCLPRPSNSRLMSPSMCWASVSNRCASPSTRSVSARPLAFPCPSFQSSMRAINAPPASPSRVPIEPWR